MAKSLKRAGIVFFAFVLSLLLVLGTMYATDAVENNSNSIVNTNSQNNEIAENNENVGGEKGELSLPSNDTTYEIPKFEYVFELSGTCTQMADGWTKATQKSLETGKNVKVILMNDWVADDNDDYVTSFGESGAFYIGRIAVMSGIEITLDLNGNSLNRNLVTFDNTGNIVSNNQTDRGNAIYVAGKLNLMDNKYDSVKVHNLYNQYKDNETALFNAFNNLGYGKITGGAVRESSVGGGIGVNTGAVLNVYSGIVAQNYSVQSGAIGVLANGEINIYDGLVFNNYAESNGGIGCDGGNLNIYGGIVAFNKDSIRLNGNAVSTQGGGIWYSNKNGKFVVDNAILTYNSAESRGGGIIVSNAETFTITNSEVTYNKTNLYAGGIYTLSVAYTNMQNSIISNNYAKENAGAMLINTNVLANFTDLQIENNSSDNGVGGIFAYVSLNLNNVLIAHNQGYTAGGVLFANSPVIGNVITLKGPGVQIYGNTKEGGADSDVHLVKGQFISVYTSMSTTSLISKIGIDLATTYGDVPFTTGYSVSNKTSAKWYFFANDATKQIAEINGEVSLAASTTTLSEIPWYWTSGSDSGSTTEYTLQVPYTGQNYKLTFGSNLTFKRNGTGENMKSFETKDAGSYSFYYTEAECVNNVFTFTILPKQVDLEWTTTLTFNGIWQTASAKIKSGDLLGSDTCIVNVTGSAMNVGEDYYSEAIDLSNKNYKINHASKYGRFKIVPADLIINIATDNVVKSYTGNSVIIGDKWYSLSATLLGLDNKKSLGSVFNIDYSKFIPMFTMDGVTTSSAINVGKYDISVKEFDANSVFTGNNNYNVVVNYVNGGTLTISMAEVIRASAESGYSYLLLDDNKRISYETKALIHGENDSNVNIKDGKATYVLGNIKPNTAVKTFINNLVFDTTKVNLYNSQAKLIYTNGAANTAEGITENMLNSRFELAVGTGWYIEYNVNGEKETIYLSVLGDINGDGRISASDVTYLRELANDKDLYDKLDAEIKLASLIINKGSVTSADSEIVINVINQILEIDWFY